VQLADLKRENRAIYDIEREFMTNKRRNIYTACEQVDFHWDLTEVEDFERMWNAGIPIDIMVQSFGRTPADIFFLAWDRIEEGKIEARKGGVWGRGA
jgi:hypothetical protein